MAKSPKRRIVEGIADFAVDILPDTIERRVRDALGMDAPKSLAVPRRAPAPKALPAPPKRLALPAPGPGLPPGAAKPRGGQWWTDRGYENQFNNSPEEAAREGALSMGVKTMQWQPDEDYGILGHDAFVDRITSKTPEQQWLERALTKYYKNDFGSPEDPLRSLAERGLHYDPEMTPEKWQATVNSYLMEDPIQHIMFPPNVKGGMPGAGSNFRGEVMSTMPWLAKLPATDKVYGIQSGGLDLEHFTDEFYNALNPEASGLPMDLAVRPESLDRMTFAQAAEHVGKINQYRAKQMEQAALSALDSPVVHLFKDYPENNPKGLRWVEMAPPKGDAPTNYDPETELAAALKYEGDTMGHCVGGYCPDVMSGRSRIFSLRDAKGEPHVTIETKPQRNYIPPEVYDKLSAQAMDEAEARGDNLNPGMNDRDFWASIDNRVDELKKEWLATAPDRIVQIKGKQNRAPKDDYLPFVQDFVKSQQWGNVGDLENTGLVRLPDGRYITTQQAEEGVSAIPERTEMRRAFASREMVPTRLVYDPSGLDRLSEEEWSAIAPYFEGFAIGGRVDADRCFCHNPLSVKKGR